MANSEKSFQTELLKRLASLGGACHAMKITSVNIAGIPDLYIKRAGFPGIWLELKYEPYQPSFKKNGVPVRLTTLQRHFIAREQQAGGEAGWAVCVGPISNEWAVYAGSNPDTKIVPYHDLVTARSYGAPWNVSVILDSVYKK